MGQEPQKVKSGAPRWMRLLLGGSLALNFLVLGLVGGALIRFGGADGLRPPPQSVGAMMFRELSKEDRRALWDRSTGMRMANGMKMEHHERRMAQARAVSAALGATPYDEAALAEILQSQSAQRQGAQEFVQKAWLERIAQMSDEQRQAYAARLEHAMKRPMSGQRRNRAPDD